MSTGATKAMRVESGLHSGAPAEIGRLGALRRVAAAQREGPELSVALERERVAVGREGGARVGRALGQAARRAGGIRQPDRFGGLVGLEVVAAHHVGDARSVRRDRGLTGDGQCGQVVGAKSAGHGCSF